MERTSPRTKLYFYILIGIIILGIVSSFIIKRYGQIRQRLPNPILRSSLMSIKSLGRNISIFEKTQSGCYSNIIYDFKIERSFSGPLPWSDLVLPEPSGTFSFTWRVKLVFPALFAVISDNIKDSDYIIKLLNREGLPLYVKTNTFTLPKKNVELQPDIYIVKIISDVSVKNFIFRFLPVDVSVYSTKDYSDIGKMRKMYIKFDRFAERDFVKLIDAAKSSSNGEIVKMPKARVRGKLIDENGRLISEAKIGLSGRTREHLRWFPSLDVKIIKGGTMWGMPCFKLYRLGTKSGLYDFVFLSILKDMGLIVPRQEIVNLFVNGEDCGLYFLMETPSRAFFTKEGKLEGDILGVDIDKMFFDYPRGAELDLNYFYRTKDSSNEKFNQRFFLSEEFTKRLEDENFARYLAFASIYYMGHGLGVDDLRFYEDTVTNLFSPIPRDLNPGCWNLKDSLRAFLTHAGWLVKTPSYTVWPVKRLLRYDYKFDRNENLFSGIYNVPTATGVTDMHFSIVTFLTDVRNLCLTNRYLKYFANNRAIYEKIYRRMINSLREVIRRYSNCPLLRLQLAATEKNGIPFLGAFVNRQLLSSNPYLKKGEDIFDWNIRTSLSPDENLLPSFMSPLSAGRDSAEYKNQLKLAFLCEKKIFSILEENNVGLSKKTFKRITKNSSGFNSAAILDLDTIEKKGNLNKKRTKYISNIVTYLGTHIRGAKALVFFLVRNAMDDTFDYAVKVRDGMAVYHPIINTTFTIGEDADRGWVSLRQVMMNHFVKGEKVRLLVYEINLGNKPIFYRLTMPKGSFFLCPPYMYLPTQAFEDSKEGEAVLPEGFVEDERGIHIPEDSRVSIDGDIVIPKGKSFYIHKGVTLIMSPESSIQVNGNLYILGTKAKKVSFLAKDDRSWGGIYAGSNSLKYIRVVLRNVEFDNFGNWPKTRIGQMYLNGGLTFYHAKIDIEGLSITNAKGEDALNCISSVAYIKEAEITGSYSDGIDFDFTDAYIENFKGVGNGGDALDLSYSLVKCTNCWFEDNNDKGISVGEMSNAIVSQSVMLGNQYGIANKDQSFLVVKNSRVENNKIGIAEFIKKPYFGRPRSVIKNVTYKNNRSDYRWLGLYIY
ncbi:MAG: hypothetical protein DRP61_04835 [Candidatus Omnitrophota bacterium]|nr:MAG: hypothetical protein DRP61_04835 [Candidatus Omnitrophota bacterium]